MSKSYNNFIALSDSPDEIRKKVAAMFTDPQRIKITDPGHPDTCNVYAYYKLFAPQLYEEVYEQCKNAEIGCVQDKQRLAECIVEFLKPFQEKRKKFAQDRNYLDKVLKEGAEKARAVASSTLEEVKKAIGI